MAERQQLLFRKVHQILVQRQTSENQQGKRANARGSHVSPREPEQLRATTC